MAEYAYETGTNRTHAHIWYTLSGDDDAMCGLWFNRIKSYSGLGWCALSDEWYAENVNSMNDDDNSTRFIGPKRLIGTQSVFKCGLYHHSAVVPGLWERGWWGATVLLWIMKMLKYSRLGTLSVNGESHNYWWDWGCCVVWNWLPCQMCVCVMWVYMHLLGERVLSGKFRKKKLSGYYSVDFWLLREHVNL